MATSDMTKHLLDAMERLQPLIKEHAASAETNRQLSSTVYDAMYAAGLFTMLAPKAYGGLELHPVETMQVWEAVARLDASAAWNLVMNQAVPHTRPGCLRPVPKRCSAMGHNGSGPQSSRRSHPCRGGVAHHRTVSLWEWVP